MQSQSIYLVGFVFRKYGQFRFKMPENFDLMSFHLMLIVHRRLCWCHSKLFNPVLILPWD
jgi:hypothetical protein